MGPASPAGVHRQGQAVSPLGRPAVRPAAVAGSFYPSDADELTAVVDTLLERARLRASEGAAGPAPVALVAPHAGYVYSGPVAASAYDWLGDSPMRRVAVLGPAHYVPLTGIAVPAAAAFATPIGEVPVEVHTCAVLAERQECVTVDDRPHRSRSPTCWTPCASTATCCRSSAPTCPTTSTSRPRSDAIGIRRRQSWTGMPPRSVPTTRAACSLFVVSCTGRAGTSSTCDCCTWAPLPRLAETHGVWSAMARSPSCRLRVSAHGDRRLSPLRRPPRLPAVVTGLLDIQDLVT